MEGAVRFADRQPGTSTAFVDAVSAESLLQFVSDGDGIHLTAFHLYDSAGAFVAESEGLEHYPNGVTIHSSAGELLLAVPENEDENIHYRLYNSCGDLLTRSDGVRTVIYRLLRMEGVARNWAPVAP
jgi:hypothetical protein